MKRDRLPLVLTLLTATLVATALILSRHTAPAKHASPRSPHWPEARAAHLKIQPCCAVCGRRDKVDVHHVQPFHERPELELDQDNMITLCAPPRPCHLWFGHLDDYHSYNKDVTEDAAAWKKKLANRPKE